MTEWAPAARALAMSPEYWMPPSATSGHALAGGGLGAVVDGGELGHADAGHHPGGADRPRAHAELDRVGARPGQGVDRLGGGDVAGDDVDLEARP